MAEIKREKKRRKDRDCFNIRGKLESRHKREKTEK